LNGIFGLEIDLVSSMAGNFRVSFGSLKRRMSFFVCYICALLILDGKSIWSVVKVEGEKGIENKEKVVRGWGDIRDLKAI